MGLSAAVPATPSAGLTMPSRAAARRFSVAAAIAALIGTGVWVAFHEPYTAGSPLGYNLGLVGGVLMLTLLPYALRKRLRCLRSIGTMRGWFLFHIAAGLFGPLLVLFHSTFRIGSFNGGVALASTLLVTFSGIVGRFLYRKVHRGLSGSRATLKELEGTLQQHLDALQPQLQVLPAIGDDARRYIDHATAQPARRWQRAVHFMSLGGRRHLVRRSIRRAVRVTAVRANPAGRHQLTQLLHTIDAATATAQRTAQFTTYERLFALWHVIHIPFLFLLVLSAVVHVIAVHAY
ncbi:hypothetical protein GPA22_17455 [Aromatoleum toluvorans]|uniref:Uncharacterized protein n=1 Tax=Aromatoleum toluvorans TaxID=92002 RepID=A0ABX1Q2A9_9RHOO|nr:hypothetical protein [Aromatoleum toluvorans]NMG45503.1 hypothetical protein [Aromatoleum toluvorans]